jgi:hypothetical protein
MSQGTRLGRALVNLDRRVFGRRYDEKTSTAFPVWVAVLAVLPMTLGSIFQKTLGFGAWFAFMVVYLVGVLAAGIVWSRRRS